LNGGIILPTMRFGLPVPGAGDAAGVPGEPPKYGWYREWEGEVLAAAIARGEPDQIEEDTKPTRERLEWERERDFWLGWREAEDDAQRSRRPRALARAVRKMRS
jgi:hypothetical protein